MPPDQQGEQPTLPARRPRSPDARNKRRQKLMQAVDFCQSIAFDNSKVRDRYFAGMETGTLPVPIERAVLEIAYGRPQGIDKRLLDALGDGAGLITILLRRPLSEDPLANAKQVVDGKVIEREALPLPAGQSPTIIPPSRPRKPRGSGPPLKPGEEILP